jgi:hypothetical protein
MVLRGWYNKHTAKKHDFLVHLVNLHSISLHISVIFMGRCWNGVSTEMQFWQDITSALIHTVCSGQSYGDQSALYTKASPGRVH